MLENKEKVFGQVSVTRSAYIPATHYRWSGGYTWTVAFLTRGGNIPMIGVDSSCLESTSPYQNLMKILVFQIYTKV